MNQETQTDTNTEPTVSSMMENLPRPVLEALASARDDLMTLNDQNKVSLKVSATKLTIFCSCFLRSYKEQNTRKKSGNERKQRLMKHIRLHLHVFANVVY